MRVWAVGLTALLLFGSGCAGRGVHENSAVANESVDPQTVVIANLVEIMRQVFDPVDEVTLQLSRDDDGKPLVDDVVDALMDQHFPVRMVSADQGAYLIAIEKASSGDEMEYALAIGDVEARRRYRVTNEGVEPRGPLQLSGTTAEVTLDDSMLIPPADGESYTYVERTGRSLKAPDNAPTIALVAPTISGIETDPKNAPLLSNVASQGVNARNEEVINLYFVDENKVMDTMFGSHERVSKNVIIFADDSLVLGDEYKAFLKTFISDFDESRDLINVIGCSNGPTALEMGNQGLALGRARRVSDELSQLGIPDRNIYDEGCWAPTSAGDRFPARGVVVELWRDQA
ncbi:MAG: hypothetical protein CSB44_09850 [Gammaproteobacteria bacterium]|nr:MAG: hypothetical protein CSB44_09850 [Gammaproteobacteria bacterium]